MNGTKMFSFKGASPLKPVNSTSDSSLIIGHKTGIAITNTVKKRFYGVSNRDASSIIARKTSQNIAKILNDPVQRNTASDTVNKRDVYTALTRVPNAPTITGGDRDFGQLTIYFNAGEENQFPVENYAYSLNNGEFILFDPVDIDSPLYITSGLANGTTYTIHIAAVSYYGMGASSNPITLTTFDVPAAPTNLNKYSISASDAIITFTAGYNGGTLITNYEYKLNGGQWIALSPADASSPITITGLSPSTTYSLLLRAVNGVGAGAQSSNAINFTTMSLGGAAPSPPTLTYLLADDGQAYVYFIQGDTNGSTIIDTEFSKDGGMNWISMGGIDQPLLATGLTNGVVHEIKQWL
jgi:titin